MQKHICGQCNQEFDTEQKYLDHTCKVTGFTPKDPENLGEGFQVISEVALARGAKREELEMEGKSPEEAVEATREIGKVVA
jgi:hypothetical protein